MRSSRVPWVWKKLPQPRRAEQWGPRAPLVPGSLVCILTIVTMFHHKPPPHPTPVRSNQPTTLLQDDRTRSGTLCGNNLPGWKGVPRKRSDTEGLFQASASDTIHEAAPFWNTHSAFLYTLTAVPLQPKSVTQSCIWTLWHHLMGTIWTWFCRDTLEFLGQILQSAVQHSKSSNQRSSRKGGIMPETLCSRGQCEQKENDATLTS